MQSYKQHSFIKYLLQLGLFIGFRARYLYSTQYYAYAFKEFNQMSMNAKLVELSPKYHLNIKNMCKI